MSTLCLAINHPTKSVYQGENGPDMNMKYAAINRKTSQAHSKTPPGFGAKIGFRKSPIWYNNRSTLCKNDALRGPTECLSRHSCQGTALPSCTRIAVAGVSIRLRILKARGRRRSSSRRCVAGVSIRVRILKDQNRSAFGQSLNVAGVSIRVRILKGCC